MRRSASPKFLALLTAKHSRFYPYPTSFTVENQTFHFQYLKPMEDHVACVTYLAELVDPPGNIVVKFVSRYGKEVHEFLANKNYAPHLRYYGPMPDAPLVSPPRPQNAPAGLAFGFMQMVVMDYIVPTGIRIPDRGPVSEANLSLFGY